MKLNTNPEFFLAIMSFLLLYIMISNANSKEINFKRNVERIIDGDTIELSTEEESDLIQHLGYKVRIMNFDTPELHSKSNCEKKLATEAKKFLEKTILVSKQITLINPKWDKFGGRILADIDIDGILISTLMIQKGYAIPYYGDKKKHVWCKD